MSSTSSNQPIEQWLNPYQLAAGLAFPRTLVVEAGRRGGKSEHILAPRLLRCLYKMPGASGFLSGKSYSKLLEHMLPALITGWSKLGFIEDEDYVVGKSPPRHFKARPLMAPKSWDHYILTSWGSGIHLMSQDHSVTANSLTTDFGAIDEAKQHHPDKVQSELLKTLSGHRSTRLNKNTCWGDLPEHLSLTLLSDKYIGKFDHRWLDKYKKDSMSMQAFYELMALAERVQNTRNPYLERELWERQRKAVVYIEYSSRESLPVIGIDYYEQQFKSSSRHDFITSILNLDVPEIEGGFYPFLNESIHGYEARDNSRIDSVGISNYLKGKGHNCKRDLDLKPGLKLKLSIDYGSLHTWYVVYQFHSDTYWLLNNFWSDEDEDFLTGLDKFCDYYELHNRLEVELYDDPGGHKKGTDQRRDVDKVISRLRQRGWHVVHMNPDNTYVPHHVKFRIMAMVMDESEKRNPKAPKFRVNLNNAYETYYSMSKTPIKKGSNEYHKDKSSEGNQRPGEEWKATHLSDGADNPICFDQLSLVADSGAIAF